MILVRELSAKGSRGRRDWRQEVVAQRMARGRKRLPRERVEESDVQGKWKRKRQEMENGHPMGMMGERARRDSKVLDGERGGRAENEESAIRKRGL